ncbi:hypothetical protein ACFQO1_02895 [Jejudonia soesokkakensis]|uniref:Prenyltransferase n=1 Tax=Jejudonia soesokkakensis TaxID=1323432 RepID=A0ABW2MS17_9FLAO
MKVFLRLLDFYINSSIHVALAVCSLLLLTYIEFKIPLSKSLLFFVFFGTISGYNFIKYAKVAGLHHSSLTNSLKSIQVFSVMAGVLMFYFAFQLSISSLATIGILGILTVLYAVPFLYRKSLRNVQGLKIFIVAFVWAGLTGIVPFIEARETIIIDVLIIFLQRFIVVLVLIFPFEIRDLPYDALILKTVAQKLGVINVKRIGYFLLAVLIGLEFLKEMVHISFLLSLLIISLSIAFVLFKSKTTQSKYFTIFWVEGLPILWLGLVLLLDDFLM